jgi:hypothetical protein
MNRETLKEFVRSVLLENVYCRVCGDQTDGNHDTCEEHRDDPTKLQSLGKKIEMELEKGNTGDMTAGYKPYRGRSGGPKPPGPFN